MIKNGGRTEVSVVSIVINVINNVKEGQAKELLTVPEGRRALARKFV